MGQKIISIVKDGVRYDMSLDKGSAGLSKQEPIASDEPVISLGAIVTLRGHKGKVLQTEGDQATVSWEDAAISKVPIKDLKYEGRVEKGGPGSGIYERKPSVKEQYGRGRLSTGRLYEPKSSKEAEAKVKTFREKFGLDKPKFLMKPISTMSAKEVQALNVKLRPADIARQKEWKGRVQKGGEGSGRYPKGSGKEKDPGIKERLAGGQKTQRSGETVFPAGKDRSKLKENVYGEKHSEGWYDKESKQYFGRSLKGFRQMLAYQKAKERLAGRWRQ